MSTPRLHRIGRQQQLRAWLSLHLQCAVASLGAMWRSPWGTALTAAVIGIALALPMGAWLVVDSIASLGDRVAIEAQASVFLHPQFSNEQAQQLADEFAARADVLTARVISKEEGLAQFREAAGLAGVLDKVSAENPLPAVIVLSASDPQAGALSALTDEVARHEAVEFVQMDREWMARLDAFLGVAEQFLLLLSVLLGAGVMLVVGNTLRMSIEGKRAEIEIAKLFGASDAFVRRAFLYHGMYFGLFGAVVAWVLLLIASWVLHEPVARLAAVYMGDIALTGLDPGHAMTLLAAGVGLGLLGAWLSVAHHLQAIEPR